VGEWQREGGGVVWGAGELVSQTIIIIIIIVIVV
jgi:hypothetical protein